MSTTKYPIVEIRSDRNAELVAISTVVVSQPGGGDPLNDSKTIKATNDKSRHENTKEASTMILKNRTGEKLKAITASPTSFLKV